MERALSTQHDRGEAIVERALHRLLPEVLEVLVVASVADRESRALTEAQANAMQAYQSALEEECRGVGRRSTAGLANPPPLHRIMVTANLRRLAFEELESVLSGMEAQQEGRAVSADEAAALQAWRLGWERLCEMAGHGGARS